MKNSLKFVLIAIVTLIAQNGIAQKEFTGKATYMSKTTVDLDKWGGNEMSPERKKNDYGTYEIIFGENLRLNF